MTIGADGNKPGILPLKDLQRIAKAQKFYERNPRNRPQRQRRWPVGGSGSVVMLAQAPGGGIASGTTSSPTSGTVTVFTANPSTAALSTGSQTLTAYNVLGVAISASKLVVILFYQGFWYIIGTIC